ncbi:MAG: AzlC family ABC transporter permease [Desulfuromonadales bacterium]|nr:AzlC family ABC transporter permease [Desulfuromonadales bacterium]
MATPQNALLCGVKSVIPLLVGVVPFSLITGLASTNAGFTPVETIGMSCLVFAGASQLAVIDLVNQNAAEIVIILTGIIINLRFCMYSASLAPHFSNLTLTTRGFLAYLLTDHAYAVSIVAFNNERKTHKHFFYIGAAATLWVVWQTSLLLGIFLGVLVPSSWPLDFVIPLTFLGLMFLALTSKYALVAAVAASCLMFLTHGWPYNLGLFFSAFGGVLTGFLANKWCGHGR